MGCPPRYLSIAAHNTVISRHHRVDISAAQGRSGPLTNSIENIPGVTGCLRRITRGGYSSRWTCSRVPPTPANRLRGPWWHGGSTSCDSHARSDKVHATARVPKQQSLGLEAQVAALRHGVQSNTKDLTDQQPRCPGRRVFKSSIAVWRSRGIGCRFHGGVDADALCHPDPFGARGGCTKLGGSCPIWPI